MKTTWMWTAALALVAAVAAPASRAEPPPFPAPAPEQPAPKPAAEPDLGRPPTADPAPAPGTARTPVPTPVPAPFPLEVASTDLAWTRWNGSSLRFEQARFEGQARLFARSRDRSGWIVFAGADLDAIVRANPSLEAHPELPALRAHVAGPASVRLVVQGFGLAYDHDPLTREARLFSRGPQGETMWPGADLAAIAAQNPEATRLPEWAAFEARVRNATAAAETLRFRPGQGGVAIAVFGPQDVTLTLHQWRGRGWQARSFRGPSLASLVRGTADLARTFEVGDVAMPTAPSPAPATTTPYVPTTPQPPRTTTAPPPPRTYPPTTPPAPAPGGGAACGAGGKACGR